MKPREPTLPIFCPSCGHTVHVAITKLQQGTVGVVCVSCKKAIQLTPAFVEAIRQGDE